MTRGKTCEHCGEAFTPDRSRPRQRFCSLSCSSSRKRLPWIVCAGCAARFPQRHSTQRFCSVECRQAAMAPLTLRCPICDRVVTRQRSRQRFCSLQCANLSQRLGVSQHVTNRERVVA